MKAPDKIYQCRFAAGKYDVVYRLTPDPYTENTEYIRKDLLLEWANKKLQESADRLDFHANQAYAEVINKLNSL